MVAQDKSGSKQGMDMEKPVTTIRDAESPGRLHDKGLVSETATEQDIETGLRLLFGFTPQTIVPTLQLNAHGAKTRVAVTMPNISYWMQAHLKAQLAPLGIMVRKGTVEAQWINEEPKALYPHRFETLTFDIVPAQKPELLKILAGFINAEASIPADHPEGYGGRNADLLQQLSAVQNRTGRTAI
jgi:hypothetical protein